MEAQPVLVAELFSGGLTKKPKHLISNAKTRITAS
jgi:hypothetical protein